MLAAIIIYLQIGLFAFLVLASSAPGGSKNNLQIHRWSMSDWFFAICFVVLWVPFLILILIARSNNVPTNKR